jgi:hypothetical protein
LKNAKRNKKEASRITIKNIKHKKKSKNKYLTGRVRRCTGAPDAVIHSRLNKSGA